MLLKIRLINEPVNSFILWGRRLLNLIYQLDSSSGSRSRWPLGVVRWLLNPSYLRSVLFVIGCSGRAWLILSHFDMMTSVCCSYCIVGDSFSNSREWILLILVILDTLSNISASCTTHVIRTNSFAGNLFSLWRTTSLRILRLWKFLTNKT
jgi:hypothetical protein